MSKLQTRLVQSLETNNRTALELVKISSALIKMVSVPAPTQGLSEMREAAIRNVAEHANRLAQDLSKDNQLTIELLDQFP